MAGSARLVHFADGTTIGAHAVVLATGVTYRRLEAAGIGELTGRGVFYGSAATEAPGCAGEDVYIVGGANSAGQAAVYFARYARRVHMLIRGRDLRASMSQYLIEPDRRHRQHRGAHLHRGGRRLRRRAPASSSPCATSTPGRSAPSTRSGCSSSSGPSRAPSGWTGWSPATPHGFVLTGTDLRRRGPAPGRLVAAARPVPPRVERPGRLRRRRRTVGVGEAGRLGGRRGRDGRFVGTPVSGGAMTPTDRLTPGGAAHAVPVRGARRRAARAAGRARAGSSGAPPAPMVFTEGEPATCFFVLLSGMVSLSRKVHGDEVEITRTEQRGVYGGATQAFMGDRASQLYPNSMRAITDVEQFVLPADIFGEVMRQWFPMAVHLLEGLFLGLRNSQTILGERERLLALGSLSAGLTHELNNPAAAAVRATAVLRDRVAGMRHKLALIADGRLDGRRLHELVEMQEAAVKQAANAPEAVRDGGERRRGRGQRLARGARHHHQLGELSATLVAGGATRGVAGQHHRRGRRGDARAGRALAHVHSGHRAAHARDRRRGRPDLRPGRCGQAVLAAGPGAASGGRRARAARRHDGHAEREGARVGHGGARVRPDACPRSRPTRPS